MPYYIMMTLRKSFPFKNTFHVTFMTCFNSKLASHIVHNITTYTPYMCPPTRKKIIFPPYTQGKLHGTMSYGQFTRYSYINFF